MKKLILILTCLWFLIVFIREGMRVLRSEKERSQKALLAGILAGGFAFLFHNLVDMDVYVPGIALLWWAMIGLTMIKDRVLSKIV